MLRPNIHCSTRFVSDRWLLMNEDHNIIQHAQCHAPVAVSRDNNSCGCGSQKHMRAGDEETILQVMALCSKSSIWQFSNLPNCYSNILWPFSVLQLLVISCG